MTQAARAGVTPSVGARIASALADSGLTPTQLARELVGPDASQARVNTMRRLLSKWMSGRHSPSAAYVSRLAQILHKPENYFTPSGVIGASPVPPEIEKEAIALVWEAAINGEKKNGNAAAERRENTKGKIPHQFDRDYIAKHLAPSFFEKHILIDRVTEWVEGSAAVAETKLTQNVWKLGRWYKDSTLIPGLLILEALAQTASVALLTSETYRGRIVLCAGYDNVRIRRSVSNGEILILHAQVRHLLGPIAHFNAWATTENEPDVRVAAGLFTIAVH
jgi:3-hydroxyacyl-[acyl-carrier-protein] dehydratase